MEDNRNRENYNPKKFKEVYKEELLNNHDLSYAVREMIEKDCVDLSDSFYWIREVVNRFKTIDEYLRYNVDNLGTYEYNNTIYLSKRKYNSNQKGIIKVSTFNSLLSDCKYNLYVDDIPGDIHLQLKEPITIKEAVDSNIGVLSLDINSCDKDGNFEAIKGYIEGHTFIDEIYMEDKILTTVYDLRAKLKSDVELLGGTTFRDYVMNPYPIPKDTGVTKKPYFIEREDLLCSINVYKSDGKYIIELYDMFGRKTSDFIEGTSLYDAYSKFMTRKGFFNRDTMNTEYDLGNSY